MKKHRTLRQFATHAESEFKFVDFFYSPCTCTNNNNYYSLQYILAFSLVESLR